MTPPEMPPSREPGATISPTESVPGATLQPTGDTTAEDEVDEASEESFPASDAPGWTPQHV